jgi:Spy/CpxP family protein refolding chaperone
MKKLTTLAMIGASALALTATAASAQPYRGNDWQPINQRQAQLERRIDRGVQRGDLTRSEANRLHREFRDLARLEGRYRYNGLNMRERADLDRRFDRLAAQIRFERNDRDYGYGYGQRR